MLVNAKARVYNSEMDGRGVQGMGRGRGRERGRVRLRVWHALVISSGRAVRRVEARFQRAVAKEEGTVY